MGMLPVVHVGLPPGRTLPLQRQQKREPRRQPLLYQPGYSLDKTLHLPAGPGESARLLQQVWQKEALPCPGSGRSQTRREAGGEQAATNPGHCPKARDHYSRPGRLGRKLSSSLSVLSTFL